MRRRIFHHPKSDIAEHLTLSHAHALAPGRLKKSKSMRKSEKWCCIVGCLIALVFAAPGAEPDPNSPAAELASFEVRDGFEVSLFASEADGIAKPIQMRFDERGRLYVVCSTIYPQIEPGQIADDKVRLLEDTDGDGRADKTTVFARGLMVPPG